MRFMKIKMVTIFLLIIGFILTSCKNEEDNKAWLLFLADLSNSSSNASISQCKITWTGRLASEANSWQSVTYGNNLFVAVSSDGTARVMTSPDGNTWTSRLASSASSWASVTFGNNLFVAVSFTGAVMTNPNPV
jgi:hypothetical protein